MSVIHRSGSASNSPQAVAIRPGRGIPRLELGSFWQYRELLFFLVWRDIKIRYKQTVIGAGWAIIQPLMTMVIFTVVFGNFAKIPSDDLPYPIFAYTALVPWTYFSQAISRSANSVVASANLVSKVYFPRLIIPTSAAMAPMVDFGLAFVVLLGMMAYFRIVPTWGIVTLPLLVLVAFVTALGVSLWFSAINVRYRDIRHSLAFLVQFWLFASPVAYPLSLVPERWRLLYSLNPMVGVIEGFRWALLGKAAPDIGPMTISGVVAVVLLFGGAFFFKRMERTFADVI